MTRYQKDYILIKRDLPSGKRVYYYRLAGSTKRLTTGKATMREAHDYVKTHVLPKLDSSSISFHDYADQFYQDGCPHVTRLRQLGRSITDRHIKDSRSFLTRHILLAPFSNKLLSDVTRGDLLAYQTQLAKDNGPRTVNKITSIIGVILSTATEWEIIPRNPASRLGKLKEEPKKPGIFTVEEVGKLFGKGNPWRDEVERTCWTLAAYTGMRRGEILALRWGSVNLENKIIRVTEATKDNKGIETGPPKWNKIRVVPMPQAVITQFEALKETSFHTGPEDRVLTRNTGVAFDPDNWKYSFQYAMKKMGIKAKERNIKPHSFRHSLNTHLIAAGADSALVRESFGWSNDQVQEGYTSLGAEHVKPVADKITQLFE